MNNLDKNLQQNQKHFNKHERYELKRQRKEEERKRQQLKHSIKNLINIASIVIVVGGAFFGLGWFILNRPNLPPTSLEGHIEESPSGHILSEPMPEVIQKHMLEHADGKGKPGIIIQYNCQKYFCEPDLVQKLTELVKQYPENVYLAPNNYDGKIILTKLGKIQILDVFDEQIIRKFIEE